MDLEEQIEKGKKLVSLGNSLGKDTTSLEERVRTLEALLKGDLKKSPKRLTDSSIREEVREVIRDGYDSKLRDMICPEPNDPKQETSKKNTKKQKVEIKYSNGNLRIETPGVEKLYLEIKREFTKDSIKLHDGTIYIAFYYLPVVLKTLEERVGRIEVDSAIPDVELTRRFLRIRQVKIDKDLVLELENPITKALLERKSPAKVAEIRRQLKTELRRSRWIDSVWDAVEKASKEVVNVVEMKNEFKMAENRLKEMGDISLTNGKTSPRYHERGVKKRCH